MKPPPTRADLERNVKRLRFAEADMNQAAAGAANAVAANLNINGKRCLWAGVAVTYARPFCDGEFGRFDRNKYAPSDPTARALHNYLFWLRNKLLAHSEDTDLRSIVPLGGGTLPIWHAESYDLIPNETWMRICSLATEQAHRFKLEGDALDARMSSIPLA